MNKFAKEIIKICKGLCLLMILSWAKVPANTVPLYMVSEGEEIYRLEVPGGKVESAQALIDEARRKHPEAVWMIKAAGDLWIEDRPLRLAPRTVLVLSPQAGVKARPNSNASALIYVEDAESVAVVGHGAEPALIDGGGKNLTGIQVLRGKRMVFDRLRIRNCGLAGIDFAGADADAVNEAGTATRSRFENNGAGLRVRNTAGFICEDNVFSGQTGTAVTIESKSSVVVHNRFEGNPLSIHCGSVGSVITRNRFGDDRVLAFSPASRDNLMSENNGILSGQTLVLDGKDQQLFRNAFDQASLQVAGAGSMVLVANKGLDIPEGSQISVFDPPTFMRPHQREQIVPGRGRFELEMVGGDSRKKEVPRDLAEVGRVLHQARKEHPDDVIVLRLQGEFVSQRPEGLQLPPDVCLILDGRIRADPGTESEPAWKADVPLTQVLRLPESGFCAVSGGTLDAGRQVFYPLNAEGGALALIEGVNLTAGARDGLNTKQRGQVPLFVYRNRVFGNRHRGIWAHVAHRIQVIDNVCSGNGMDGIDMDAYAAGCTVLFNVSSGNGRHGVFVEEAVKGTLVVGNVLSGNKDSGVHVWNEAVVGNTGGNVMASNICDANARGVSVGGRSEEKTALGNFFFNNLCRENRLNGMWAGNVHAKGNYFCRNRLEDNQGPPILEAANARYFNPPIFP